MSADIIHIYGKGDATRATAIEGPRNAVEQAEGELHAAMDALVAISEMPGGVLAHVCLYDEQDKALGILACLRKLRAKISEQEVRLANEMTGRGRP